MKKGTPKVDQILCYGNTINEPLEYDNLVNKFSDLGQDVDVEDYILKLVYFNYYNNKEVTLSFHDLITFLETNVYNNHELSKKITPELKENINRLKNFATTKELSRLRTSSDLASILGVDETQVKQLLILYNSSNPTSKITLTNLANFINKKVLTNNTYKNYLGNDQKALLKIRKILRPSMTLRLLLRCLV